VEKGLAGSGETISKEGDFRAREFRFFWGKKKERKIKLEGGENHLQTIFDGPKRTSGGAQIGGTRSLKHTSFNFKRGGGKRRRLECGEKGPGELALFEDVHAFLKGTRWR